MPTPKTHILTSSKDLTIRCIRPTQYQLSACFRLLESRKLNEPKMISKTNSSFIVYNQQKILILTDSLLHRKTTTLPFDIDILIVGNGLKFRTSEILNCVHPKICVIDQTISPWYAENLQQFCLENKIKCYDVKKCGAVRMLFSTKTYDEKTTHISAKNKAFR